MIDGKLIAKRQSALFGSIVLNQIERNTLPDFPEYFFENMRPFKNNTADYTNRFVETTGLHMILNHMSTNDIWNIEGYRGASKTESLLSYALYLGEKYEQSSLIVCENDDAAKKQCESFKRFLMASPRFSKYIPKSGSKGVVWDSTYLTFVDNFNPIVKEVENLKTLKMDQVILPKKIFHIRFVSMFSGKRGGRELNLFFDDVVTELTSGTIEGANHVVSTFISAFLPFINRKGGRVGFMGTPQNKRDMIHWMRQNERFASLIVPVKDIEGNLLCEPLPGEIEKALKYTNDPFIQDQEWLDDKIAISGGDESSPFIQKEYFLNVYNSSKGMFSEFAMERCKNDNLFFGRVKDEGWIRIMGIDPHGTKDVAVAEANNSDYAAIAIVDFHPSLNKFRLVNIERTRDILEWEQMIYSQFRALGVDYIAYEGYAFSNAMQEKILDAYSNDDDYELNNILLDSKGKGSKEETIMQLLPYFLSGNFELPYATDREKYLVNSFIEELQNLGSGNKRFKDDVADCCARTYVASIKIGQLLKEDTFNIGDNALSKLIGEPDKVGSPKKKAKVLSNQPKGL